MNDAENYFFNKAHDFLEAKFQNVELVLNFAEKHKDSIYSVFSLSNSVHNEKPHRDRCIEGLWYRVYFWLQSLKKLNSARDFQAYASANRGLFELTVDLALLHDDKTNSSGWKMWHWNLSEKLQGAKNLIRYYEDQDLVVPNNHSELLEFVKREEISILNLRKALWNIEQHPNRWTKRNLFDDLKPVENIIGASIKDLFGTSLTEYYRTEYKMMNWQIHSGVSSFWGLPEDAFASMGAFFLEGCANFGLLSTHIVLKDLGFDNHLPDYFNSLETLKNNRLQTDIKYLENWT